jgi:tetratricopeptide (TPR) repeat protein
VISARCSWRIALRQRFGRLAAVLVVLALALPARAQQSDRIALERFQEGTAHYDARRYEEARVAFLQALALDPQPRYLLHLGHAELRVGQAAQAATHLAAFLRQYPDAPEAERQEADIDLAAARARVTEITLAVPPGAEVLVDGVSMGKAPFEAPIYVTPGFRRFVARRGDATEEREVEALPGRQARVELLAAPAVAPPGDPGSAAAAEEFSADPPPTHGRKPVLEWFVDTPPAWLGVGVAGLGLVLGTTFALTAKTHFDRADDIREELIRAVPDRAPCDPPPDASVASACQQFTAARDTGETQRTLAIVGFAVSGVAVIGTVAYYFMDPRARVERDAAFSVTPVLSDRIQGLAVSGHF